MRVPALTMAVVLAVFGAGCTKHRTPPKTPTTPRPPIVIAGEPPVLTPQEKQEENEALEKLNREDRERLKTKDQLAKDLNEIREKLEKLRDKLSTKRAEGFDVGSAEKIWKDSLASLEEAGRQYFLTGISEDFSATRGLIQSIKDSLENKTIEKEMDKSPRFREKTKPKPAEFNDDRDLVISRLGHPSPHDVKIGPYSSFSFQIFDPTGYLAGATQWGCYDPRTSTFTLQTPPKIATFEYHKGQEGTYQFVFIENNHCTQQVTFKDRLTPAERDQALTCFCMSQGSGYENFKLIGAYKGKMAGTPDQILGQLLESQFRFADQFGLGAMTELAKGGAAMPDLKIVGVVFSAKLVGLNKNQKLAGDELEKYLRNKAGDVVEQVSPGLVRYDQEKSQNIKKAAAKVFSWQSTLLPQKNAKKNLAKLFNNDPELIKILDNFEDKIKLLAKEIKRIQEELQKFRVDLPGEVGFASNEIPSVAFLIRGVGFETDPTTERTLAKKDVARIKITANTFYKRNKDDDNPPLVRGPDIIRISEVNKLIDLSKEYQRLTSFMIGWPSAKTLAPGNYRLELEITDEVREKAINYKLGFIILPPIE